MKPFTTVAVLLLALIAVLQGIRFVLGWPVTVGSLSVPPWFSAVAFVVIGALALMLWRERRA